MYRINAMIPLSNDSKRLPDDVYKAIERTNPPPQIGVFKEVKKRRVTNLQYIPLGPAKAAVKGPAIIIETHIDELPESCPYLRLLFTYHKDFTINPVSVNFVFTADAGDLPSPNYTWVKI